MTHRSLISTFPTLHKLAKLFWPITTRVSSENIIFLPLFRFPVSLMYSLRGVLCIIVQALLYQSTIIDGWLMSQYTNINKQINKHQMLLRLHKLIVVFRTNRVIFSWNDMLLSWLPNRTIYLLFDEVNCVETIIINKTCIINFPR